MELYDVVVSILHLESTAAYAEYLASLQGCDCMGEYFSA